MERKSHLLINSIITNYFISKNRFNIVCLSSNECDYKNPFYIFYRDVEIALSLLNQEEKMIIENEYFLHLSDSWWKPYFKEKTFLHKKEKAIGKFVRLFHEIH